MRCVYPPPACGTEVTSRDRHRRRDFDTRAGSVDVAVA